MRANFDPQLRLSSSAVLDVELNFNCRDELIPILAGLQEIYRQPDVRDSILALIAADVNATSNPRRGRKGMDYWPILVLGAARLGCNLDYDKLQDLAENHRKLRQIMGIEGWDLNGSMDWRRIRDNLCQLRPTTIARISHQIVEIGHGLAPKAAEHIRGDSFVVTTDIHYPTDANLIGDGVRKLLTLGSRLAELIGAHGWRQHRHLQKKLKYILRKILDVCAKKGPNYQERLKPQYASLDALAEQINWRALKLLEEAAAFHAQASIFSRAEVEDLGSQLVHFVGGTEYMRELAQRRVMQGEEIQNAEKIFSLFEPHTELINRGKRPVPIEFGHRVLVLEDAIGFICHHEVMAIGAQDSQVLIPAVKSLQARLNGKVKSASFDRGFHSPENQAELARLVPHPCLATKGRLQEEEQKREATIEFRKRRQNHPGIESTIGALQAGNGQQRCRDKSYLGFERYVALGVLGRNLQVLGKLLIAEENRDAIAGFTKRKRIVA